MVFSSITFLFLFFPCVLFSYLLIRKELNNSFLLLVSLIFYFWGENWLVWLVIVRTFIDYTCGILIEKSVQNNTAGRFRKFILMFSILTNLASLSYYKYSNFFIDNLYLFFQSIGIESELLRGFPEIALPLGISFYTFQSMSYVIDVYRRDVQATSNYIDFACYVSLFPQLVAGPIVRYKDIAEQLKNRIITIPDFAYGIKRFTYGLAKKILIANNAGVVADQIFATPADNLSFAVSWFGIICYSLQIYFDFSAYSDMAIGLGRMFGFTFLENFNYPYIATSIKNFWQRWHISLSSWFRDYVYIPLGGNQKGAVRTYINLFIVFLLCGFWHGASWTFIVWGLYHGFFLVIERLGLSKVLKRLPMACQHIYTCLVVMCGWVFFRAETLSYGGQFLKAMFSAGTSGSSRPLSFYTTNLTSIAITAGIVLSIPVYPWLKSYYSVSVDKYFAGNWTERVVYGFQELCSLLLIVVLIIISAASLSTGNFNPFLYFRF